MNLTMLAAPAALRLGLAAAEGTTRHVTDFAGHLAEAFRGDEVPTRGAEANAAAQSDESAVQDAESEDLRSLNEFLRSIGVDSSEAIEWDSQADRIAKINADRFEPWQATSLRRWLDDRPHLKPIQ